MHQSLVLRPLHRIATAVLLALITIPSAHALSVVPRSFDELVTLADLVIVGAVGARQGRGGAPGRARGAAGGAGGGRRGGGGARGEPRDAGRSAGGGGGD